MRAFETQRIRLKIALPLVLGAVADAWSFQWGILILGIITLSACSLIRGLKNM